MVKPSVLSDSKCAECKGSGIDKDLSIVRLSTVPCACVINNPIFRYCLWYPEAGKYFGTVQQEVCRKSIPVPTEWAKTAIHEVFYDNLSKDDQADYLHVDEFKAKLLEHMATRWNLLFAAIHREYSIPHDEAGECIVYSVLEFIDTGYCEADVLRKKYESFFCPACKKLCNEEHTIKDIRKVCIDA